MAIVSDRAHLLQCDLTIHVNLKIKAVGKMLTRLLCNTAHTCVRIWALNTLHKK